MDFLLIMNISLNLQTVRVQNAWLMSKQRIMQDLGRNCVRLCASITYLFDELCRILEGIEASLGHG